MTEYRNDCVSCGFPCMGNACPYHNVMYKVCDKCKNDTDEEYYTYSDKELCLDCLIDMLDRDGIIEKKKV